ncbi:GlxA family transcriptional regulator [Massilia sp. SM-13]|uniref:GlxA family transcriptional regulator n=1 Tax=Pseudoduganella rhizocola TaxID=3382643 RepID=UPI0038B611E5
MKPHLIVIAAFPPAQMLDISGPLDALTAANTAAMALGRSAPYRIELATPAGLPLATTSGIALNASCDLLRPDLAADTLMLAGGPGARAMPRNPQLVDVVGRLCHRSPRISSICTGAFALAATGELNQRRATTHWAHFDEFAACFPQVLIERDALFIADGKYHTSAGVSAGIDYTLAMIQNDLGRSIALQVARDLVMFLKRPGGQSQFSAHLTAEVASGDAERFAALTPWLEANLGGSLSVTMMADHMAMSPRNFARRFKQAMNVTPHSYLRMLRVDAARRMLSDGTLSIARIAQRCGFASTAAMRAEFAFHVHVSPEEFRARFQSAGSPPARPLLAA